MSEDSGARRRGDGSGDADPDDARPLTAAGRRRRSAGSAGDEGSAGSTSTGVKGAPTRSREAARATPTGSPIARLQRFLREVVAELRKVHWPTRRQIVVYTFVVLVFVSFMVAFVALLDAAFAKGVFALFG